MPGAAPWPSASAFALQVPKGGGVPPAEITKPPAVPQAQDRKPQVAYKTEIIGGVVVHTPISINQVSLRAVLLSDRSARSCWWRPWGATGAAESTRVHEAAPCEPVGCSWGQDLELCCRDEKAETRN